jgi:hypothetical protein
MNPNKIRKDINEWFSRNFNKLEYGEIEVRIIFHAGNIRVEKAIRQNEYHPVNGRAQQASCATIQTEISEK